MNRKEEIEALAKDCERYAKIIVGISVVPDDWKPDEEDRIRQEPRETLLKAAAAIRASAAPEEGMNHRTTAEPDRAAVEKVILEFQHSYVGDHAMLLSYKGKPTKAALNFVDTILAALPSDSGKAAPEREKAASDAPVWYDADSASAWADGYNAALSISSADREDAAK